MDLSVSVIIPTFNRARYIAEAVESALDQTLPPLEVIVIDDGSTDGTRDVLAPYLDRIRYVYQTNQGNAAARNLGLSLAKGDLIANLDSDDSFERDKLANQAALLRADSSIGMVHSGWTIVDAIGRPLRTIERWHEAPCLDLKTWLLWKPATNVGLVIRREWLKRVDGWDTALHQAVDTDLTIRLALAGCRAVWLRRTTFRCRQHDTKLTSHTQEAVTAGIRVVETFFQRPEIPREIRRIEPTVLYYTLLWSVWRLLDGNYTDEAIGLLRRSKAYRRLPPTLMVVDWVGNIRGWLARDGRAAEDVRQFYPSLRTAADLNEQQWRELEPRLENAESVRFTRGGIWDRLDRWYAPVIQALRWGRART